MRYGAASKSGFSLIEIIVVLAIIGVLGATITPFVLTSLHTERERDTAEELKELKKGILGNPEIVTKEVRTDFGYIGDMGSLPTKLEDLYQKGTQPAFVYDNTKKAGAGWNGPYISPSLVENLASLKLDTYGNEYVYDATEFTDAAVGATVSAKIASKGADSAAGGGDDITAYIYKSQALSNVIGFVKDEQGNRVPAVVVKMNYPSSGTLTTTTTTSDATGLYQFTDIPYGNRSITVEPKLAYAAGSAVVSGTGNQNVEFKITNFAASDIAITSFRADYTVTPAAYYQQLKIGGTVVYDSTAPRLASGDTVTFAPITITGSHSPTEGKVFSVRIQSPLTQVADLNIGSGASKGGTLTIFMKFFKDAQSGSGNAVDMTGVTFEVTFSDGSKALFSAS